MIRLVTLYGSFERDVDLLVVADSHEEGLNFITTTFSLPVPIDFHIVTTERFMKLIKEDPFYANVVINGEKIINELKDITGEIMRNKESIMEVAKMKFEELCKKGAKTAGIAYYYLISKGMFPKDRYEVRKIIGIDPKNEAEKLCQ